MCFFAYDLGINLFFTVLSMGMNGGGWLYKITERLCTAGSYLLYSYFIILLFQHTCEHQRVKGRGLGKETLSQTSWSFLLLNCNEVR